MPVAFLFHWRFWGSSRHWIKRCVPVIRGTAGPRINLPRQKCCHEKLTSKTSSWLQENKFDEKATVASEMFQLTKPTLCQSLPQVSLFFTTGAPPISIGTLSFSSPWIPLVGKLQVLSMQEAGRWVWVIVLWRIRISGTLVDKMWFPFPELLRKMHLPAFIDAVTWNTLHSHLHHPISHASFKTHILCHFLCTAFPGSQG